MHRAPAPCKIKKTNMAIASCKATPANKQLKHEKCQNFGPMQLTMILLGGASPVKVWLYELFTIALTCGFDHVFRPMRVTNNGKTQDSALVWRQARQILCNFEAWM